MTIDGSIESFSPFHNINCPKGFLYFNKQVQELFVLFYCYTLLDSTELVFIIKSVNKLRRADIFVLGALWI